MERNVSLRLPSDAPSQLRFVKDPRGVGVGEPGGSVLSDSSRTIRHTSDLSSDYAEPANLLGFICVNIVSVYNVKK